MKMMMDKTFKWKDIAWKKNVLMTRMSGVQGNNWWTQRKQASEWICEDQSICRISMPIGKGKVTDAGYDNLCCLFTRIHEYDDFIAEADITVRQFLHAPGPSNQEGFGLFLRETVKRHPALGIYYSNMAAVGGYYGRYNFFGRYGIAGTDVSHIDHFAMYERVNRQEGLYEHTPLHYKISESQPEWFHLVLRRKGDEISVRMADAEGEDVLAPERNGGAGEISGKTGIDGKSGFYYVNVKNAFSPHTNSPVYIGFFAARGTIIDVHKDSFQLTIRNKRRRVSSAAKMALHVCKEESSFRPCECNVKDYVPFVKKVWNVSPEGKPSGDGSVLDPVDIYTAIKRCGYNEQISLQKGHYYMPHSVCIGKECSGKTDGRKILSGAHDGKTVFDFMSGGNAFSILGDYWIIENVHVTGGYGIKIEGSYNWLRECSAFRNFETGILIRYHSNSSERNEWPSYNFVDNCCAYENRDAAECNADGFACKVASGPGNVFKGCISFLNSDDGFDLFSKNRVTGAVVIEDCCSYLNGYKIGADNHLEKTGGNGNGFKLGGSGLRVEHRAYHCLAEGNRQYGFTNNSNPFMSLQECRAINNGRKNISYEVYEGSKLKRHFSSNRCIERNEDDFVPEFLLEQLMERYGNNRQ